MEGVGNQRSGGSDGCLQGRVSEGGKSELVSLLQPDPVSPLTLAVTSDVLIPSGSDEFFVLFDQ